MQSRWMASAALAAMLLAGCGPKAGQADGQSATAPQASAKNEASLPKEQSPMTPADPNAQPAKAAPAPDFADPTREVLIREIAGQWTVEKLWVDTSGVTAYTLDDPAALGSVMTITPDKISWTKAASDQFTADDICGGPAPVLIRGAPQAKATGAPMAGALAYFGIPKNELGPVHEMGCLESGNWGPEAAGGSNFYLASGGRMVMSWYDGAVLLLKRR